MSHEHHSVPGTFDTAEEAGEIYKKAALIFHKEFANFTESKNLK